jgi:arylsulfatase
MAQALLARWDDYAKTNNVILPNRSVFESSDDTMPPRFPDDAGYPPLIYMRQFIPPPALIKR